MDINKLFKCLSIEEKQELQALLDKEESKHKDSITIQGITYYWGEKLISGNGYECYVVTSEGVWGLIDEIGDSFCPIEGCDLSWYRKIRTQQG